MLIIGCDYHPSVQQIALVDTETGECGERRLTHCGEAEQFYRELKQQGVSVHSQQALKPTRLPGRLDPHAHTHALLLQFTLEVLCVGAVH